MKRRTSRDWTALAVSFGLVALVLGYFAWAVSRLVTVAW